MQQRDNDERERKLNLKKELKIPKLKILKNKSLERKLELRENYFKLFQ